MWLEWETQCEMEQTHYDNELSIHCTMRPLLNSTYFKYSSKIDIWDAYRILGALTCVPFGCLVRIFCDRPVSAYLSLITKWNILRLFTFILSLLKALRTDNSCRKIVCATNSSLPKFLSPQPSFPKPSPHPPPPIYPYIPAWCAPQCLCS